MKKLNLSLDLLKNYMDSNSSNEVIAITAAMKFFVTTNELGASEGNWYKITQNKDTFKKNLEKIAQETRISILTNHTILDFLNDISEDVFEKFITYFNEKYTTSEFSNMIRELYSKDRNSAQFVIPNPVLNFLVRYLDIKEGSTIIDSFCGLFGVVGAVKENFEKENKDFSSVEFYGQEKNNDSIKMAELLSFVETNDNYNLAKGDSILEPAFTLSKNKLKTFDYAISCVPLKLENYYKDLKDYRDNYNRFRLTDNGYIKNYNNSWLPVEHIISTLNDNGKAAIIIASGLLFRSNNTDKSIRKSLVDEDIIECIVKLPAGILNYTMVNTNLLIINKNKPEAKKNKIQFIDLSERIELRGRKEIVIPEKDIQLSLDLFRNNKESEISFIVDNEFIAEKDYSLEIFSEIKKDRLSEDISKGNTIKLSEVATIRRGVQLTKSKIEAMNKEKSKSHYLVSLGNIVDDKIILREQDKIAADDRIIDLYELQKGDIVLTSKGSILKIVIVDENIKNAIISSNLCLIRVSNKIYNPTVLKYFLESEVGMLLLNYIWKGNVIKSIANKDLENLSVPNIDICYQKELENLIKKSKSDYLTAIQEAETKYKDSQEKILNKMKF